MSQQEIALGSIRLTQHEPNMNPQSPAVQKDETRKQPDALYIGIIERKLSDKSKVFSVVIREDRGLPFIEIDAIDEQCANNLRQGIRWAIQQNTNIKLA